MTQTTIFFHSFRAKLPIYCNKRITKYKYISFLWISIINWDIYVFQTIDQNRPKLEPRLFHFRSPGPYLYILLSSLMYGSAVLKLAQVGWCGLLILVAVINSDRFRSISDFVGWISLLVLFLCNAWCYIEKIFVIMI